MTDTICISSITISNKISGYSCYVETKEYKKINFVKISPENGFCHFYNISFKFVRCFDDFTLCRSTFVIDLEMVMATM
jgi:hypothetical protein